MAFQVIFALPLLALAFTPDTLPGGGARDGVFDAWGGSDTFGMTAGDGPEGSEVPMLFLAVTVTVWAVPLFSPVIVQAVAPLVVHVLPPGEAVATYWEIGWPPVNDGACQDTFSCESPGLAVVERGGEGLIARTDTELLRELVT